MGAILDDFPKHLTKFKLFLICFFNLIFATAANWAIYLGIAWLEYVLYFFYGGFLGYVLATTARVLIKREPKQTLEETKQQDLSIFSLLIVLLFWG